MKQIFWIAFGRHVKSKTLYHIGVTENKDTVRSWQKDSQIVLIKSIEVGDAMELLP